MSVLELAPETEHATPKWNVLTNTESQAVIALMALEFAASVNMPYTCTEVPAYYRHRPAEPASPTRYTQPCLIRTMISIPDKNALTNVSVLSGDLCI